MYGSRLVRRDGNQTMTNIQQIESAQPRKRAQKQADEPDFYDAAVAEGMQITQNMTTAEWGRMRLGELASQVETKYGENKLRQYAKDIGMAICTLERSRSVYRAWAEIPAAPPNFSVAQELQDHPERAQIIKDKPNITTREARKKAQAWKEKKAKKDPNYGVNKMKDFVDGLLTRASRAMADADWISNLDPEERKNLKRIIKKDPRLLDEPREAVKAWTTVTDALQRLADEPAS
jgi:hypothetical protein